MSRRILLGLVLIGLVSVPAGAASPAAVPVLGLTGGGLGVASRLVAFDPLTLRRIGTSLRLPGWAFGVEWARAPSNSAVALVPKPSETNERLFVVDTRGGLRVSARIALPGEDVCRLAWPSARRLLAVVTRGPACYTPIDGARLLIADPIAGRIVSQRVLSGAATIVAAARTRDGLALLVEPRPTRTLRLLLVDAARTRSIDVGGVTSAVAPLDKAVGSTIGLAVDPTGRRAYVVEPDGRITDVRVDTGAVAVHTARTRKASAVEKGIAAAEVQAFSVAPGVLAYSGIRRSASGRLMPIGLRLVDTRTWRERLLTAHATGFASADGAILAYQPFVDQLGRTIPRVGLRLYTAAGELRLRAFSNEQVELVRAQGLYAYLSGPGGTSILDLRTDALNVAVTDAYLSFELLAGPGSLTFPS